MSKKKNISREKIQCQIDILWSRVERLFTEAKERTQLTERNIKDRIVPYFNNPGEDWILIEEYFRAIDVLKGLLLNG
jgi:hypothetical protein